MLFHVTHTHSELTCPYHNEEVREASFSRVLPAWAEAGVTVIGGWTDPPAHQMFFVIDADRVEDVHSGLAPIIDQGTADIQPVVAFSVADEDLRRQRS